MSKLTHFNEHGAVHMVDVGGKSDTRRVAIAAGSIQMQPATLELIKQGNHKKGDVLGIMAAKKTSDLVPLCHPVSLTHIDIELCLNEAENTVSCECRAETHGKTGVEMEALTAVQATLLTVYDMCKAVDRGMVMGDIKLLEKSGGKSGDWRR